MIGRMYSSVVGQNRLALHTEVTDGFQVTSERDRYLNKLKACSSFSKPGSALISGSACDTSANARLIGKPLLSLRRGESSSNPGMRLVAMRKRSIASILLPFFSPNAVFPVSAGAAKGSKPALVQSARISLNFAIALGDSNVSTYDNAFLCIASL